jgi:hypothetical protein
VSVTLFENRPGFGRTDALDAAQRSFVGRIDVHRRAGVTERGEHCRGNHDFSQHMESAPYNLPATITGEEIPV